MPPIRTAKKNQVGLGAFFKYVEKDQAIAAMAKSSPKQATAPSTTVLPAAEKGIAAPSSSRSASPLVSTLKSEPPPSLDPPKKRLPKPIGKGIKVAHFDSSKTGWEGRFQHLIGTSTRTISFGYAFVLTDSHIDDIFSLGNGRAFQKLTSFSFEYSDVSYDAHNLCKLTKSAVIKIAKLSPNLKITLQSCYVGDDAFRTLFRYCPQLTTIETSDTNVGKALDALRDSPQCCPNLKKIILGSGSSKPFMKSLRELGKARPKLIITLVSQSQIKKWGDWELETCQESYRKGRKLPYDWNLPKYHEPPPWFY